MATVREILMVSEFW